MSNWFSDLAGKAEAFLDSVDQSAASKLQTPPRRATNTTMSASFSTSNRDEWEGGSSYATNLPRVPSENVLTTKGEDGKKSHVVEDGRGDVTAPKPVLSMTRPKSTPQFPRPEVTDDQLIAFLNAPPPAVAAVAKETTAKRGSEEPDGGGKDDVEISSRDPSATLRDKISNLELENRLLKREVASLNDELTTAAERSRQVHAELVGARKELEPSRQRASRSDQLLRDLQGRQDDLTATLTAKDSQLAVLRVRLQEADEKVKSYFQSLETLKRENERVVRDHSDSSGVQHQVLEELRRKLEDAEANLTRERESLTMAQTEALERHSQWDVERQQMSESLKDVQQKLTEERRRVAEFAQSLKLAKAEIEQTRKEFTDYKEKAQRILQSKDKLISELKAGDDGDGEGESSAGSAVVRAQLEQTEKERDLLRDEVRGAQMQLEHLRGEIQEIEQQQQNEADHAQGRIRELEDGLEDERRQREVAEQEAARRRDEIEFTQTELFKQKSAIQVQLQEREDEIKKMRRQLNARSALNSSQTELEARVRSLTENLIQKQTVVETLTTEKTSLTLQLDRAQSDLKKFQVEANNQKPNGGSTVVSGFREDENTRMRPIASMLSPDFATVDDETQIKKGVRRAANSIDKFSIRLGRFLRQYPIARVFVIFYMFLLHLWVMVVLLTYEPETHTFP